MGYFWVIFINIVKRAKVLLILSFREPARSLVILTLEVIQNTNAHAVQAVGIIEVLIS